MSLVTRVGNFLFGSNIKPNTGDKHTDIVAHQVYEKGVHLLAQDNYIEALNHFKKASSFGHISAKYNQALMLFDGVGDYPDFTLSKKLFIEAKAGGHQRCDVYIDFMNKVDEMMSNGQGLRDLYSQKEMAYQWIILDPTRGGGGFIYLVSRELIRVLGSDESVAKFFAKEFIRDELTAMHLGNEVCIKYLKDMGYYNPNIEIDWDNQFENRLHMYMNYNIYTDLIKYSRGILSMEDLVYSKCCVVNEVIKRFRCLDKE